MDAARREEILQEVARRLRACREPRRWRTAGGLARDLERDRVGTICADELEALLIEESTSPDGHPIRYSRYPSRRTLEQLFGHTDVVGEARQLPDLERTDEPEDAEALDLEQDAPFAFVSHNARDARAVLALRSELARHRISAWVFEVEIERGKPIADAVKAAIASCTGFVLYLTRRSFGSMWVSKELEQVRPETGVAVIVDGSDAEFLELLQRFGNWGTRDFDFAERIALANAQGDRDDWVQRGRDFMEALHELPDPFYCWPPLPAGESPPAGRWRVWDLNDYVEKLV